MIAKPAARWTVLIPGELTEGRFAVVETRVRRGAEPPRHLHTREDELVYVLEGRVTFDRDGERLDRPTGSWLYLPRGCEHTFSIESAEARLLVVLSPAGLERCRCESAQSGDPVAADHDVERLVAIAAHYGVAITGPGGAP